MLQIKKISKQYRTGDLVQSALDNVSINLRDNEFVAVLGPSGSGKTTLLNIIGGLDQYDSGNLIINSISTKQYKDRDWDSYRNHTIGFVFQSYNLIPHQSILANVELALTISGISRNERKKRAKQALADVGLGDQMHKKPNQMSGGQMQRVAIARALVNNPDILLADEPTGALDTETSVQVMELLKEVAKNRLVVMVTHNPELAEAYATRIVRLRDGKVIDDTDPFEVDSSQLQAVEYKNMGKSSMSYLTALSLSFNNLKTKKGRTFLTSFAGSIGIIGIAMILSLSNGVNTYITDIQKSTMLSYPVTIEAQTMDLSSFMELGQKYVSEEKAEHKRDGVYLNGMEFEMASAMTTSITKNNLTEFKKYLDDKDSEIHQYIGENGIVYNYAVKFNVYTHDPDGTLVNTDGSTLNDVNSVGNAAMGGMSVSEMGMAGAAMGIRTNNFTQILPGAKKENISPVVIESYDVLHGNWPKEYNEVILVLDHNNEIPASTLYELGLLPSTEYKEFIKKIDAGEEIVMEAKKWTYEEICEQPLFLIPACDMYLEGENGLFTSISGDETEIEKLLENAIELKISGVVRLKENIDTMLITQTLGYTKALTDYMIEYTDKSAVVKAQKEGKDVNVLNGAHFSPSDDATKIADTKVYVANMGITDKATLSKNMLGKIYADNPQMLAQMMAMGETELVTMFDQYMQNPQDDILLAIYDNVISTGSYDMNMETFGVVSLEAPAAINIYADSFEDKDGISDCIKTYNERVEEKNKITYTDYVGLLMSSVTTIIDVISYVLIAFVSVSLVVSSIMIGIITYISVLERTKEIGILRAIGASKKNIRQVFNAETFIIGLGAGLIGVGVTMGLLIPINAIIHALTGNTDVNAALPVAGAVILVILSVILTLIGGIIPSKKAAKKDPVTALRTE